MSKTGKIILWVVVVVIVVGGIWWWMANQSGSPVSENYTAPTSTATGATSGTQATYPQGSSNQSITQDMTSLNTQMNGLSSDNASVTQSMSDQPVPQAQ